jgi:AcrR family transcriptional regulator
MSNTSLSRGEQTRWNIIQAAYRLFIQQGYHGTSMRQIAGRASISLSGVYNHFTGKEEVFKAVFLQYHPYHQILPFLLDVPGKTIDERIKNSADYTMRVIQEDPDFLNLMFIEIVEFKSIHAGELFSMIFPQAIQVVHHLVGDEQDKLRPVPTPILIRSFLGLFFSYFSTEILFANINSKDFQEDAMEYLVDIYLHGVLVE